MIMSSMVVIIISIIRWFKINPRGRESENLLVWFYWGGGKVIWAMDVYRSWRFISFLLIGWKNCWMGIFDRSCMDS